MNSTGGAGVSAGALPPAVVDGVSFEKALIGLILAPDGDRVFRITTEAGIETRSFSEGLYRKIWRAATEATNSGNPIDCVAISTGQEIEFSVVEDLIDHAPVPGHAEYIVERFSDSVQKRRLEKKLQHAIQQLGDESHTAEFVAAQLSEGLGDATRGGLPTPICASAWTEQDPPDSNPVVTDVFDRGDKVCIIAGPKMRKSFFLLQMGMNLAAGQSFLKWRVAGAFRVLVFQLEIQERHYHRRLLRTWRAMGKPDIGDRLHVVNCRGCATISEYQIADAAKQVGADIIAVDPLYKFMASDAGENAAEDMKPTLAAFDRIAQRTGAAVVYVHHDPKNADERNIRDRGAGSGVLARDYDACITLTQHRDNPDAAVVHTLLRNYPPQDEFCATFEDGRFVYDYDLAPVTGKAGKYDQPYRAFMKEHPGASLLEIANAIGCDKSTASRLRSRLGVA